MSRGVYLPPQVRSPAAQRRDRKSTRLNSSHTVISYAVFCLKKKKKADLPGAAKEIAALLEFPPEQEAPGQRDPPGRLRHQTPQTLSLRRLHLSRNCEPCSTP